MSKMKKLPHSRSFLPIILIIKLIYLKKNALHHNSSYNFGILLDTEVIFYEKCFHHILRTAN